MSTTIDIRGLRSAVEKALGSGAQGLAAGWSRGDGKGRVYKGATFEFEDDKWAVVRGAQRPSAPQLLDTTAWFMIAKERTRAVALLDPETTEARHPPAPQAFRKRYQAAAWFGLGIMPLETEGQGAWLWRAGDEPKPGSFGVLAGKVAVEIDARRRSDPAWATEATRGKNVKATVALVRGAVAAALGEAFRESDRSERAFDALWRRSEADGAWARPEGLPRSIALEVRVGEDVAAPFGQVLDDLGSFDAVLCVRLVGPKTKGDLEQLRGLPAVKAAVQARLPVRFLDVSF